ncbi:2-oxoacid dehydrogenases acyltransferase (catalytic domain) [uncultured archaeon]|nr:2-oxoacid dehydrogenases acyltransferase (catalytic domain) [uncultured archaeon]
MEDKESFKSFGPTSTLTVQIKSKNIHSLIEKIKSEEKYNLSPGDIIIYSICKNLKNFPELNSKFDNGIMLYPSIDLGYFINIGRGSEIINIKHADQKSLIELSKEIKEMALKYLHGELSDSEKQNGSFSITNLFSFGVYSIIPPIYENQSAMISISSEFEDFESKDTEILFIKRFNLTLSYDSRVADCQKALQFLNRVKDELENGFK